MNLIVGEINLKDDIEDIQTTGIIFTADRLFISIISQDSDLGNGDQIGTILIDKMIRNLTLGDHLTTKMIRMDLELLGT